MLELLEATRKVITRYIAQTVPLTLNADAGDDTIFIASTRRFNAGDKIIIRNSNAINTDAKEDVEFRCISRIADRNTLILSEPLVQSYTTNYVVQKIVGGIENAEDYLRAIYLGDPAVISRFPAITIDAKTKQNDRKFTLESIKQDYDIVITIYIDGQVHHESQYKLMHYYTQKIEEALLRTPYPLVGPFKTTTLAEDVNPSDDLIRVQDENFFQCGMGWIFLENSDILEPNRAEEHLGNGVLKLVRPMGASFYVGDSVIHPLRHMFYFFPESISYGIVNKGTMLKAAQISLKASEERRIYQPYIDPLSF